MGLEVLLGWESPPVRYKIVFFSDHCRSHLRGRDIRLSFVWTWVVASRRHLRQKKLPTIEGVSWVVRRVKKTQARIQLENVFEEGAKMSKMIAA